VDPQLGPGPGQDAVTDPQSSRSLRFLRRLFPVLRPGAIVGLLEELGFDLETLGVGARLIELLHSGIFWRIHLPSRSHERETIFKREEPLPEP
jgi:hypothetical protein